MLRTKSILAPKGDYDRIRISIMSRHTLRDGITPDKRIDENSYDEWLREFAPPLKLIGDYYKRNLPWEKFEERYLDHLKFIYDKVKKLSETALKKDITLLCIKESSEKCHRRLLAEECKRIKRELEILVK